MHLLLASYNFLTQNIALQWSKQRINHALHAARRTSEQRILLIWCRIDQTRLLYHRACTETSPLRAHQGGSLGSCAPWKPCLGGHRRSRAMETGYCGHAM